MKNNIETKEREGEREIESIEKEYVESQYDPFVTIPNE